MMEDCGSKKKIVMHKHKDKRKGVCQKVSSSTIEGRLQCLFQQEKIIRRPVTEADNLPWPSCQNQHATDQQRAREYLLFPPHSQTHNCTLTATLFYPLLCAFLYFLD